MPVFKDEFGQFLYWELNQNKYKGYEKMIRAMKLLTIDFKYLPVFSGSENANFFILSKLCISLNSFSKKRQNNVALAMLNNPSNLLKCSVDSLNISAVSFFHAFLTS